MDTHVEFRIKVFKKQEPYLGIGRIELLERIIEHGSIAQGAKSMDMSYRKAWQLVENMNRLADEPLVLKSLGGSKGGGAIVTDEGKAIIRKFHQLRESIELHIRNNAKEIGL